eukprot:TRINITY_DN2258_c0_g2_i1.p1 TRINITY_DN2258_c0_g2~~TRINITY_DN2258_c0_g2_i1.p1  ORF type:complete len:771 (+),score=285.78 TRINITY_DN2258_c0_g2_i1:150-2462(+)
MADMLRKMRRRARELQCEVHPDEAMVERLCLEAEDGNVAGMAELLKQCSLQQLNAQDCTGQPPLHVAVCHARLNIVEVLLQHGAAKNTTDTSGRTPLDMLEFVENTYQQKEINKMLSPSSPGFSLKPGCGPSGNGRKIYMLTPPTSAAYYHITPPSVTQPVAKSGAGMPPAPSLGSAAVPLPPQPGAAPAVYGIGDNVDAESMRLHEYECSLFSSIQEGLEVYGHRESDADSSSSSSEGGSISTSRLHNTLLSMPDGLDSHGLILVMVGLPGRGKTYIARRLCRWLNWKGTGCRIFNVGKYRREITGKAATHGNAYFDPNNAEAAAERERHAEKCSQDLKAYLVANARSVAIFDATNSTTNRRSKLVDSFAPFLPKERIIFIESVCTDQTVIHNNILRAKMGNEDYQGKEASYVLNDFKARIEQYEKAYQPLSSERDGERSWIQLRNTISGHHGGRIIINNLSGHLPTKLLYFLFNLRTAVFPVYFAPFDRTSSNHRGYSAALRRFFNQPDIAPTHQNPTVLWTSTCERAAAHTAFFQHDPKFHLRHYQSLRGIDKGDLADLDEATLKQTNFWTKERSEHRYSCAYPRGESQHDVNVRLEQIILDVHGSESPVCIIAEAEVLQGLYAYFAELLPEMCVHLDVPQHTIIQVCYHNHAVQLSHHDISQWVRDAPLDALDDYAAGAPAAAPPAQKLATKEILPAHCLKLPSVSSVSVATEQSGATTSPLLSKSMAQHAVSYPPPQRPPTGSAPMAMGKAHLRGQKENEEGVSC